MPSSHSYSRSQQGFSLIEVMVGFTIAASLLVAIAPLLMVAVGTRVQNYRAEQAMQLAQSHINRIQALMTQGVPAAYETGKIPPETTSKVAQVGPPTTLVTDINSLNSPTKALEVDYDGDKRPEFIIQMFRDPGIRFNSGAAQGELAVFQVGIRVYAGAAKDNLGSLDKEIASINLTDGFGEQKLKPLAVLYTEVSRSDLQLSLQRYQDYLNQP